MLSKATDSTYQDIYKTHLQGVDSRRTIEQMKMKCFHNALEICKIIDTSQLNLG